MAQVESVSLRAGRRETSSPALAIAQLRKSYGAKLAVRGVSLEVKPGSIHGLVGPNGSGKSTILRSVLGLIRPDAGSIRVLGGDRIAAAALPRGGLAGLVDDPRFYPYLSARANLRLLARMDGGGRPDFDRLLERAGLAEAAGRRVGGFSLGMRQRLGVAAALMREPRVLLLDEPANGLDPAGAEELWNVVRELAAGGTAVLLSSHDLVAIDDLCHDITVMRRGAVAWSGAMADLRALAPAPEHLLLGSDLQGAAELAWSLEIPARHEEDGLRLAGAVQDIERLTVEMGRARIGFRSLTPGASPLRTLFASLTEDPPAASLLAASRESLPSRAAPLPVAGEADGGLAGRGGSAAIEAIARAGRPRLGDVWAVCAVEARKLAAQKRIMLVLLACLIGPWLFELAVKGSGSPPSDTLYGQWMVQSSAALPLVALTFAASWGIALFGSLVGGDAFSSEDRLGTWPTLLTRSRPQSAIVAGKIVVSAISTLVFVVVLAASASLAGLVLAEHGPLPGLTGELFGTGHAFKLVAISWAAALPVALSWTALGLVLSARTRNSVIGIGAPALIGILLQAVWIIDGPPLIGAVIPQAALNNWHGLFQTPADAGPLVSSVLVALGWAALWVIALALVIRRRDAVAP